MTPACPALRPPVKSNVSCADVQLLNVTLAVPTATPASVVGVGVSTNQLPDRPKSAFVALAPASMQVTFGVKHVIGIEPLRPPPSLKM